MPVTKRDRIWHAALSLREATETETERDQLGLSDKYGIPGFTAENVQAEIPAQVGDRTVRDCLNAMVELGELSKRSSKPSQYRAPKQMR